MRRSLQVFCSTLALGLAFLPLLVYSGPSCPDIQRELSERVKAFVSMHLMDASPSVKIAQPCGVPIVPDAMWFFYRKLGYHLGIQDTQPLSWSDLRLRSTQALLQHPDLGIATWDVRLNAQIEKERRLKVEDMLGRYLKVNGRSSQIEFKRGRVKSKLTAALPLPTPAVDGGQENFILTEAPSPVAPGKMPILASSFDRLSTVDQLLVVKGDDDFAVPLLEDTFAEVRMEKVLPLPALGEKTAMASAHTEARPGLQLWDKDEVQKFMSAWRTPFRWILTLCLLVFSFALLQPLWSMLLKAFETERQPIRVPGDKSGAFRGSEALFLPFFIEDWRERCSEILSDWSASPTRLEKIRSWIEKDKEATYWALIHGTAGMREALIEAIGAEQIMALEEFTQQQDQIAPIQEIRALVRFMLLLAREGESTVKQNWGNRPLFISLLTAHDWLQLASHLSRSRRRWLAVRLGENHAAALRLRNEPHFDWALTAPSQENEEQLIQKVRALLETHAASLRECLGFDREALDSIDRFFGLLSGDVAINSELALVCLASIDMRSSSFSAQIATADGTLAAAMQQLEPDVSALALFDCDSSSQRAMLEVLGSHKGAVGASLRALIDDRNQIKKWRMRSKTLQRFLERQVLIAKLFIRPDSVL